MCGIAGYMGRGNKAILEKMTNAIGHRGPDDDGFFVDANVGLGHRRLSIIDLSPLGHQPMWSHDQTVAIVFNGEIYNFQELKKELVAKGYPFKSHSDTEVILAAYQAYGTKCFAKLNGMFAIALYDKLRERLVLARDRLGKKPLYWTVADGTLVFGSELKAMVPHPVVRRRIDHLSLGKYLAFDYVPTPHTIFQGIYKLEPGHFLVYENGKTEKTKFWDITFNTCANRFGENANKSSILSELDKRLAEAVKIRMVADVPLGIFLSGGLDSSTIAYYAQKQSKEKIKTFSIGFSEKSFDESGYARKIAAYLGTEHHEHILSARESLDLIPRIAEVLDEPLADYSIIPTYLLSRFTRGHVTVALGGDGGDELFFGYPTFTAERFISSLKAVRPLLKLLKRVAPTSHAYFNLRFKLHQLLQGLNVPDRYRHAAWLGTFGNEEIRNSKLGTSVFEDIDRYLSVIPTGATKGSAVEGSGSGLLPPDSSTRPAAAGFGRNDKENRWNQLVYLYMRTYLMDQVLVKVDRASMANSLEVRAPLLDYTFVDFVNSIPYHFKIKGITTKYLLKELMKDKLPREIVYRKKQGFGVPLASWLAKELKPFLLETLSEANIKHAGLFDPTAVKKIMDDHLRMKKDNRKQLWSLLVFQMWFDKWMK